MALHDIQLEERMLACILAASAALEEERITADTWRLSAILSTWLHRPVTFPDSRVRAVTGWSLERIGTARQGLARIGWSVEPTATGGYQCDFATHRRAQEWGEHWKSRLPYRTAMKHAAIFPPFDLRDETHRLLVALGVVLSHRSSPLILDSAVVERLRKLAGIETLGAPLVELHNARIISLHQDGTVYTVEYTHEYSEQLREFQPLFFAHTQVRAAHEWSYTHMLEEHLGKSLRLPPASKEGRTLVIYALSDPRPDEDGRVRYVGQTIRDDRAHQHASIYNAHSGNPRYHAWVKAISQEIGEDGRPLEPVYEVLETSPYDCPAQADRIEAEHIHAYEGLLNSHHVSYCPARITRDCN